MKVLKFGGTSVGSAESIKQVKRIVENCAEPVIVVVSAAGGITDKLIETARQAEAGNTTYTGLFESIRKRHLDILGNTVPERFVKEVSDTVNDLLEELGNIYRGVFLIGDLSSKTLDAIVSYGERLSSFILSRIIDGAVHYDARNFIKTEKQFSKHIVDFQSTNRLVEKAFADCPRIVLTSGFIASDTKTNDTTNLGRGGSDYTAAILASALKATSLEIWTDVDGFMTADPRVINTAYVIKHLSFTEAMELCNFGAKVIYPPTIYPVFHKNIPILIKNTFNPESPGTTISTTSGNEGKAIKGISSINDTSLITVSGLGMVGVIGVNYRIFKALAKAGISVFLVSQASSENNTSFAVKNADADHAVETLTKEFSKEIGMGEINPIVAEKELATVAIVGENMKHTPGIAGKLFNTLGKNGINVIACAQGASETNISFVIELKSLRKALNVIHDSFFLSDYQVLNLFIAGTGLVGKNLLEQIRKQQPLLLKNNSLKLNIVEISNSRNYISDRNGIRLDHYENLLKESRQATSPRHLCDRIVEMNIFNSVFVDCTANPEIADIYQSLLEHNISVVAANKIAASSSYQTYSNLKRTARKKGVKFLFETNVGAGLPVINTINSLINSGDKILKIEAVISGSLNYIFNVLNKDIPLSKAIRLAQEAGYCEPDPRLDLNGSDMVRKLVILAREAGYRIEQQEVKRNLFIPEDFFSGTLERFWEKITALDTPFEKERLKTAAQGQRFRYVATLDNGKAELGLQTVDNKHPFYYLEGSNNVILLTTERYKEYPMEIKGYGAGAAVTAAGVFADIISIANIR